MNRNMTRSNELRTFHFKQQQKLQPITTHRARDNYVMNFNTNAFENKILLSSIVQMTVGTDV